MGISQPQCLLGLSSITIGVGCLQYKRKMFLSKITVQNFRLLKDFSVDLDQELFLIIGKNNSGKTSLLYLLDKIFHCNRLFLHIVH